MYSFNERHNNCVLLFQTGVRGRGTQHLCDLFANTILKFKLSKRRIQQWHHKIVLIDFIGLLFYLFLLDFDSIQVEYIPNG